MPPAYDPGMARSVIFLSTPTSANGSMFRALSAIGGHRYEPVRWLDGFYEAGRLGDIASSIPPRRDSLIKHNAPNHFNPATPLSDFRFVLNARDPRDMACNQYHWQFVHGTPHETPEETQARRDRVTAEGIDRYVLRVDNQPYLDRFLGLTRRIAPADRIFAGYAMFCLHFDVVTERLGDFLGAPLDALAPDQRRALDRERVEQLARNPLWIGRIWQGTDTAPGRHRHELQPETIRILTERYRWFLDFLRRMDDPRVAHTYD
jgi:hypothetical protein